MRTLDINTESWDDLAADSGSWKNTFHKQLMLGKEKLIVVEDEQRARRKDPTIRPETTHRCNPATETFPQIGLFNQRQYCSSWQPGQIYPWLTLTDVGLLLLLPKVYGMLHLPELHHHGEYQYQHTKHVNDTCSKWKTNIINVKNTIHKHKQHAY